MKELFKNHLQKGKVQWIGVRSEKKKPLKVLTEVEINTNKGLIGDHHNKISKKRQVTLIQAEHINIVASFLGKENIDPSLLRRNIVISNINLISFTDQKIKLGKDVILETTGPCHPCPRMEDNLGFGGLNAMQGHGGITAKVIKGGWIKNGDIVSLFEEDM